jgi:hypothetical protein
LIRLLGLYGKKNDFFTKISGTCVSELETAAKHRRHGCNDEHDGSDGFYSPMDSDEEGDEEEIEEGGPKMQGLLFSCETVAPSARRSHSCTCDA